MTWRYLRILAVPLLLWGLVVAVTARPLLVWLGGDAEYDKAALREWLEEARVYRKTLPELVREYLDELDDVHRRNPDTAASDLQLKLKAEEIAEYLRCLGTPLTKMYSGQVPLFPVVYSLEVKLAGEPTESRITWDSQLPRYSRPLQECKLEVREQKPPYRVRAEIIASCQLHAFNKQQQDEADTQVRARWVAGAALATTILALTWIYLVQRRERDRERQEALARQQLDQAERRRLEEELRREEAERRHEETERTLLEQRLATQAAEQRALELKSQLYASIGIMAGSYAHNIKNLLVRPNDLLSRCLEADGLSDPQQHMLHEVRQTLGTVTDRLQQILRTVRRDPGRSELARVDLNAVVGDLHHTWKDLAREKWKLTLTLETSPEPLWIDADLSHLQQAIENLLFNARDATFEMRNYLRDQAHRAGNLGAEARRQALIAAAAWKGTVLFRTLRRADQAVLEVRDTGIGMSEDVRRRCTETHFTTKRDNALYEGHNTGMGLGLSFVATILEVHKGTLEIESAPQQGATFRVTFPLASVLV